MSPVQAYTDSSFKKRLKYVGGLQFTVPYRHCKTYCNSSSSHMPTADETHHHQFHHQFIKNTCLHNKNITNETHI